MSIFSRLPRRSAAAIALALVVLAPSMLPAAAAPAAVSAPYGVQTYCRYRSMEVDGNTGFRLRKLLAGPPTDLYANKAGQMVGWRLIVQRRYDEGLWRRIFASVTRKSTASPTEPGVFSALRAKIGYVDSVDRWPNGRHTEFRAVLQFFWYRYDGSVSRSERHVADTYPVYRDGEYQFTSYGSCAGAWLDR